MAVSTTILEVCVASLADTLAAERGGADRLELNVALELGGLTPTPALLQQVKQAVALPVIVMIRPRAAGFCYSSQEKQVMLQDAESLLALGADGVASGALRDDQRLDSEFWKSLVKLAGDRETVLHRAFDTVDSQERLLAEAIDMGTTRILTSGGRPTAAEGAEQIARLRQLAGEAIEILPGSGVNASNVAELLRVTGCNQVHGSFSQQQRDFAGHVAGESFCVTSAEKVEAVRRTVDEV